MSAAKANNLHKVAEEYKVAKQKEDRSAKAPKSRMIIQKMADYGASDPNMARMVLQIDKISKFTTLDEAQRETLFGLCLALGHRLANAMAAANNIKKQVEQGLKEIEAQPTSDVMNLPFVQSLEILFEGYFYNAKNIIRDLGPIFQLLYGKRVEDASAWCAFGKSGQSEVAIYLSRMQAKLPHYGAVRELIEQVRQNVELVVTVRNALEHPGKRSGTVSVYNFRPTKDGIAPPAFTISDRDGTWDIASHMQNLHETLLSLAEAVTVFGLLSHFQNSSMGIERIEESKRNPDMPIAYRAVLITDEMKKYSAPFTGKRPD